VFAPKPPRLKKLRMVKDHVHVFQPYDHNDHVDNWWSQVDFDKQFMGLDPSIDELISRLENVVSKMRVVVVGDDYLAYDHNLFKLAWDIQSQINESISDIVGPKIVAEGSAENTTRLDLTGLDGDRDKWYLLLGFIYNIGGGAQQVILRFNRIDDYVYWYRTNYLTAIPFIRFASGIYSGMNILFLYAKTGQPRPYILYHIVEEEAVLGWGFFNETETNITEINIISEAPVNIDARVLVLR